MRKLLVAIPDRVTDVLAKGEYQPRYYNPGNLFDEVHILMTNDDRPDHRALAMTVGDARLHTHNWPDDISLVDREPGFLRGWRLREWARGGVEIARRIGPALVRCHGADWNTYLASRIKSELGIPYVASLHINPDVNPVRRVVGSRLTPVERRHNAFYDYLERKALRGADLVMPVYRPILPYLARMGVKNVDVCYNVLDGSSLRQKSDYGLGHPVRLICVGRLLDEKDPTHIIEAIATLADVHLTIVGDGPKREPLEAMVERSGLRDRVAFRPAVANAELCRTLADFDIFVVHTEYWELSKSVLEALLTGLPCIVNRRVGEPVPELQGDFIELVENSAEAYRAAIVGLIRDGSRREGLGRRAYAHAQKCWSPSRTERKVAGIYQSMIERTNG